MELSEERTLTAGQEMYDYLNNNASHYIGNTLLIDERTDLLDKIHEIQALKVIEDHSNLGLAVGKSTYKLNAAMEAIIIAKLVKYFAKKTNNIPLKLSVDFSFSDLFHVEDADAVTNWKIISDAATANLAAMILLGVHITALNVTDLVAKSDLFVLHQNSPKAAIQNIKIITNNMKTSIKDLDDIAEDIIDLTTGYLLTDPDFYNAVKESYRKGALGAKHILLALHYIDNETSVTLRHVLATITNGVVTHNGESTRNGNIYEKTMANGNYTITSKLPTYIDNIQSNVGIENGKIKRITIRMIKA